MESRMPITPELIAEFLEEHQIETTDDLDKFDQMIKLLFAEPNVPLMTIN